MTPDIREKAERLLDAIRSDGMGWGDEGSYLNGPVATDLISQALLEAHNAGRAEGLENSIGAIAAQLEEEMNKHGDEDMRAALGWQLFKDSQWLQERLATAIRSIK